MMSGRTGMQMLTTLVTHKQETLQYLTVDSTTYLHWRTLARSLRLSSDCDVAIFLLQHYEKTASLQMTQCVTCGGSVVQYCVPCNIYMTQPTATPSPTLTLPQDGAAALSVCDESMLSSDTILLDFGDVVETDQFLLQDIALKMDSKADNSTTDERREIISAIPVIMDRSGGISSGQTEEPKQQSGPSRLRMLMEKFTKEGRQSSALSLPSSSSESQGKSLLTPDVLHKIKSGVQKPGESATITVSCIKGISSEGGALPSSVSVAPLTAQKAVRSLPSVPTSVNVAESTLSSLARKKERDRMLLTGASKRAADSLTCEQPSLNVWETLLLSVLPQKDAENRPSSATLQKTGIPSSEASQAEAQSHQSTGLTHKETGLRPSSATSTKVEGLPSSETCVREAQRRQPAAVPQNETDSVSSTKVCRTEAGSLPSPQSLALALPECRPGEDSRGSAHLLLTPGSDVTSACRQQTESVMKLEKCQTFRGAEKSGAAEMKLPEAGGLEDEDSDYHCEPLFRPKHCRQDPGTDHAGDSSCRKGAATPWHAVSCGRVEPGGAKTTRLSPRKRCASCSNDKENTDRRNAVKSESLECQVIVVTNDSNGLHKVPRVHDTNQSQVPVYRSKRIAARMAAKGGLGEATETKPKVSDVDCNDSINVQSKVSNVGGETGDGGQTSKVGDDCGKVSKVDRQVSEVTSKVGCDGESKVSDVDCKVSIMLDTGIQAEESAGGVPRRKKKAKYSKEPRTYSCPICSELFPQKQDRTRHVKERHGDRPYACDQCSATYLKASHLRMHKNQHADVKPYPCPLCPRAFTRAYDLKIHETGHLDVPVECDVCGLRLKNLRVLKSHKRRHTQADRPYVCQVCGMAFRSVSTLKDHIRVHTKDKPFACPQCDMRFIQSGSLWRHIERRHNPNRARSFVCDICGEARYDRTQFEKHMMIHTGEKPFACDICGAAFIQVNALRGHKKIHTEREGKSHFCSVCGAAFKVLSSVKKHMNKVHRTSNSQLSVVAVEIIDVP